MKILSGVVGSCTFEVKLMSSMKTIFIILYIIM